MASITFEQANQLRIQLLSKFRESDVDDNGLIDWVEFRTLMTELDPSMSETDMRNLFDRMDVSKDSFIEYEDVFHEDSELWPLVLSAAFHVDIEDSRSKEADSSDDDMLGGTAAKDASESRDDGRADLEFRQMKEQMFALLQATDVNDDGLTDFDEFTKAMRSVLRTVTKREIKQLFDVMDFDKSGEIDYRRVFGGSESEESSAESATDSASASDKLREREMQRQRDNRLRLLFDELSTRAERAGGNYDSDEESSDEAERYLREKDEELQRARQEIDELNETYDDYKRNTEDMIRQLSTMQDEKHDQVADLSEHIERLERELTAQKFEVTNLNEHIDTLETKITLLKKEHSEEQDRWKGERNRLESEAQEWHLKAKELEKKNTQLLFEKEQMELSRRMGGSESNLGASKDGARVNGGAEYMIAAGLADRKSGGDGIDLETALSSRRVSGMAADLVPPLPDIHPGLYDELSSGDGATAKEIEETKVDESMAAESTAVAGAAAPPLHSLSESMNGSGDQSKIGTESSVSEEQLKKLASLVEEQQLKVVSVQSELEEMKAEVRGLTHRAEKAEYDSEETNKQVREKDSEIERLKSELEEWKEKLNSAKELRNELDERDAELERVRSNLVNESSRKRQSELHVRQLLQEKFEKKDHEKLLMELENEFSAFRFDKETEIGRLNDRIHKLSYDLDAFGNEMESCVRSKMELVESASKEILRLKTEIMGVSEEDDQRVEMAVNSEVSAPPSLIARLFASMF